jgi:hypothetical protein
MLFQALWLSIVPFHHLQYVSALASFLAVRLEFAFLPLRSLSPPSPQFISLFLCCLKSAFPVFSPPQASFWIGSWQMLATLRPFPLQATAAIIRMMMLLCEMLP